MDAAPGGSIISRRAVTAPPVWVCRHILLKSNAAINFLMPARHPLHFLFVRARDNTSAKSGTVLRVIFRLTLMRMQPMLGRNMILGSSCDGYHIMPLTKVLVL